MKTSFILLCLAAARSVVAGCDANNCLRGVRGTDANLTPSLASRIADCSSFMQVTVTPATFTTTSTVTATSTYPYVKRRGEHGINLRQVTVRPTGVPTYATYCTGTSAYSSACSCAGVTQYTFVAPAPTSVVYATVTATVCSGLEINCGTGCINTQNNSTNCGGCGFVCAAGEYCASGVCT